MVEGTVKERRVQHSRIDAWVADITVTLSLRFELARAVGGGHKSRVLAAVRDCEYHYQRVSWCHDDRLRGIVIVLYDANYSGTLMHSQCAFTDSDTALCTCVHHPVHDTRNSARYSKLCPLRPPAP